MCWVQFVWKLLCFLPRLMLAFYKWLINIIGLTSCCDRCCDDFLCGICDKIGLVLQSCCNGLNTCCGKIGEVCSNCCNPGNLYSAAVNKLSACGQLCYKCGGIISSCCEKGVDCIGPCFAKCCELFAEGCSIFCKCF